MTSIILGLFNNSQDAGQAVTQLKNKGYTKEISVLAYDSDYEKNVKEIKQDVGEGAATGGVMGALTGALAGILSGITTVTVPGLGLLVGGPLVAVLGLAGGTIGTLTGGLVGSLVDLGVSQASAELYDKQIRVGQVVVGVSTSDATELNVKGILNQYGATEITTIYQ